MTDTTTTADSQEPRDVMRKNFTPLTDDQKADATRVKDLANQLNAEYEAMQAKYPGSVREIAVAKTQLETASMWAVKGITA